MNASSKTKRIVCLWLPDWPLQRLLAARPELARTVLLLTEKTRRGEFVSFCNPWACRCGIAVGMPLAEALSLVQRRDAVTLEPVQPEADRIALEELALRCEQYSPCVGLEEAVSPHGLLLDITGIAHLFGGELPLIHRLQTELIADRFQGRIAVGDSVGAAWAAAHYLARSAEPVLLPCGQFELLWDLPVEGLRLGEASAEKLHRLGIRTIRQVRSLSRSSLPSRFGDEINLRLDQFLGERSELMIPRRPLPTFRVEHFLEMAQRSPRSLNHGAPCCSNNSLVCCKRNNWGRAIFNVYLSRSRKAGMTSRSGFARRWPTPGILAPFCGSKWSGFGFSRRSWASAWRPWKHPSWSSLSKKFSPVARETSLTHCVPC